MKFQSAVCLSILVLMCCVGGAWGQAWVDNFQSFNPSLWTATSGSPPGSSNCYCGTDFLQYNVNPGQGSLRVFLQRSSPCFPGCPQNCEGCSSLGGELTTVLGQVSNYGAFYFNMQAPIGGNRQFADEAFSSMGVMGSNGQTVDISFYAPHAANAVQFSWQSTTGYNEYWLPLSFSATQGPHSYSVNVYENSLTFFVDGLAMYSVPETVVMTEPQVYLQLSLAAGQSFLEEAMAQYYSVGYNSSYVDIADAWNPNLGGDFGN